MSYICSILIYLLSTDSDLWNQTLEMDDLLAAADPEHSPEDIQPRRHQNPNHNGSTASSRCQQAPPGCASHSEGVATRRTTPAKTNRNLGVRQEHGAATCQQAGVTTTLGRRAASLGSTDGVLLRPNSGMYSVMVMVTCYDCQGY